MTTFHEFANNLAWSMSPEVQEFWTAFYKQAFPTAVTIEDCQQKPEFQRVGIDRRIHMPTGRKIKVDEKTRKESFDDILLEYLSVDTSGAKGWIDKELGIDYVAYGILPTGRVYLIPYDILCRAWQVNRDEWLCKAKARQDGFTHIVSQNNRYKTYSVGVPCAVLFSALIEAGQFDITDGDSDPFADENDFIASVLTLFGGELVSTEKPPEKNPSPLLTQAGHR